MNVSPILFREASNKKILNSRSSHHLTGNLQYFALKYWIDPMGKDFKDRNENRDDHSTFIETQSAR